MKTLLLALLLLPVSAQSAEIESVRVGVNTMLINGVGLQKIAKAQLGKRSVKVMPVTNSQAVIYCKSLTQVPCSEGRWLAGNYMLKLYRKGKSLPYLKFPVTITGQEQQERPVPPEVITPTPVGQP